MVFFAIWWAWVNFTWFASAYDTDDVPYRLTTMVQIAGGLVLAAGVPRAFADRDFAVITVGYVIMRAALVSQWMRAARADRPGRGAALRFAAGVTACQVGWLCLLLVPPRWYLAGWLVLVPCELAVPVWGEHARRTAWQPRHISERYGLFTIIVLGESVLSTTVAIRSAVDTRHGGGGLVGITLGALLILFSIWWLYFAKPVHDLLVSNRVAFVWSYGHYLVFSSIAAVGAGLSVAVDHRVGHTHLPGWAAGLAVTVPVAVFLLTVWFLHVRPRGLGALRGGRYPIAVALVLAVTPVGQVVLATGLLLAALVAVAVVLAARDQARGAG
jgi:low temperature requirement protein LtrA